jgi:hypothetical protein
MDAPINRGYIECVTKWYSSVNLVVESICVTINYTNNGRLPKISECPPCVDGIFLLFRPTVFTVNFVVTYLCRVKGPTRSEYSLGGNVW